MRLQPEALVQPEVLIEPKAPIEPEALESISSSETESEQGHDMVTRRTMIINHFVPGAQPIAQKQPPQGQDQTPPPPPPPTNHSRKRPCTAEQTPNGSGDAPIRTPPRSSRNIVIREPATQTGMNVASTSRATSAWQPLFLLDGKPLPATASVRVWKKGEGGRVA